jgi:hypothetical protein
MSAMTEAARIHHCGVGAVSRRPARPSRAPIVPYTVPTAYTVAYTDTRIYPHPWDMLARRASPSYPTRGYRPRRRRVQPWALHAKSLRGDLSSAREIVQHRLRHFPAARRGNYAECVYTSGSPGLPSW